MLISEMFRLERKKGEFGIEIEMEGKGLPEHIDGWNTDYGEGSLRDGGLEYVLPTPQSKTACLRKIKEVSNALSEKGAVPVFSPRTSCHVHVNITNMTMEQACTMYLLSLLAEPFLSAMCGELREGNHFCLRGIDAEEILLRTKDIFYKNRLPHYGADMRYSFTNLAAVKRFGSIEYRGMRGTLDLALWKDWLTILGNIKKAAIEIGTPDNLMLLLKGQDVSELLTMNELLPPETVTKERVYQSNSVALYLRTMHTASKHTPKAGKVAQVIGDNPFKAAMLGA